MRKILAVVFLVVAFSVDVYASTEQGFDYIAYLSANPDLPSNWTKTECMEHYRLFGFLEKRAVAFNLEEYLNANPDLPQNWTYEEALMHYNMFGKYENRLLYFEALESSFSNYNYEKMGEDIHELLKFSELYLEDSENYDSKFLY